MTKNTIKENYFYESVEALWQIKKEEVDYKARLDWLSRMFGKENVIVRVYEKGQFEGARGDITSDFLEACGMESDWKDAILPGHVNERISNDVLGLKHMFNREYFAGKEGDIFDSCGFLVQKYFREVQIKGDETKKGYISIEDRKRILEKVEQENRSIAKEYLGRDDGILFYDDNVEIPLYVPQFSPREEQMVKMFAGMIREQDEKQKELEKKLMHNQRIKGVPNAVKEIIRRIKVVVLFRKLNFK